MSNDLSFIKDFIRHLLSATANASLYNMEHPQVMRLSHQAYDSVKKALEERSEFSLAIIENEIIIEGQPQEFSLFLNRFAQILSSRGIGHIRLIQGVNKVEINQFITELSRQAADLAKEINSSEHIRLGWLEIRQTSSPSWSNNNNDLLNGESNSIYATGSQELSKPKEPITLAEMPQAEIDRFREIYETVKLRHKLKINGVIETVSSFVDAYHQQGQALLVMAALRRTDEYTFTHSTNVSILNIAQASLLGINGPLLNDIGVAGMLHDIGKLFIPEEILTKNETLTKQEYEIMQSHPIKGASYLFGVPGVPRLAVINAFEHHLKYDLSGYPAVPAGWHQNICSQITTISDVFDALRTRRSYRDPLKLNLIIEMMNGLSGTELHPALTKNFLTIISKLSAD